MALLYCVCARVCAHLCLLREEPLMLKISSGKKSRTSKLCCKVCVWFLSLCNTMPLSDKQKSHVLLSYNLRFKINQILWQNSFTIMGQRTALLSRGKRDPVLSELCSFAITALPAKGLLSIIFISNPISDLLFHIRQAAACICDGMPSCASGVWLKLQRWLSSLFRTSIIQSAGVRKGQLEGQWG